MAKKLGEAIRLVRLSQRLEQNDVAEKAGITAQYMSMLELGKRDPTVSVVERIAEALGTNVALIYMLVHADDPRLQPYMPLAYGEFWKGAVDKDVQRV